MERSCQKNGFRRLMKEHYGQKFVPRIAKSKRGVNGNSVHRKERKKISDLIKRGRRMERRTFKQALKDLLNN